MSIRKILCLVLSVLVSIAIIGGCRKEAGLPSASQIDENAQQLNLWYEQPAQKWVEALPIGNGRLGAMVFGGISKERIQLNEESLWAGCPVDVFPQDYAKHIAEVQRLVLAGQRAAAREYGLANLTKTPTSFRSYEPLGDIYLDFGQVGTITNYRRQLSLNDAIAKTVYRTNSATITREVLISAPDDVLVSRITTDKSKTLSFTVSLTRHKDAIVTVKGTDSLHMDGQIVDIEKKDGGYDDNKGLSGPGGRHMRFAGRLKVKTKDGKVSAGPDNTLKIENATSVMILFTAATDYNLDILNFDRKIAPAGDADSILKKAQKKSWEKLRKAHVKEFRGFFDRFSLTLAPADPKLQATPTDTRLEAVKKGADDPPLTALHAQYGRYLLLSSSRAPGRLPANLQGIWNERKWAPWEADYHLNINLQMNYWPGPVANMPETLDSLIGWSSLLAERGRIAAGRLYGSDGWVTYLSTNPFGRVTPGGSNKGSQFVNSCLDPLCGAWLATQLFDAWQFSGDRKKLETIYPILAGASEFVLDILHQCPDGKLRIVPSTSPVNTYIDPKTGKAFRITAGSTYHMSIVRSIFDSTKRAARALNVDIKLVSRIDAASAKLPPIQIGEDGRILEWAEPYKEAHPGHRHVSHLIGLHPFDLITPATPELFAAARKTIDGRLASGGAGTGWSRAWTISFFARLKDGDEAAAHCLELLRRSTLSNLFDNHPPFQIDGNFGATAGVCEMLIQSHVRDESGNFIIELLPALPKTWPDGSVKGLRTRGGFEVDMNWKGGRLVSATIHSRPGTDCIVRHKGKTLELNIKKGKKVKLTGKDLL